MISNYLYTDSLSPQRKDEASRASSESSVIAERPGNPKEGSQAVSVAGGETGSSVVSKTGMGERERDRERQRERERERERERAR